MNQYYRTTVKKGSQKREVLKPIKDIAIDLWREIMAEAGPTDYVFSIGLKPGANQIRYEQITRRWRTHVKEPLGITADFASLKHTNLDEIAAELDLQAAASMASHTSTVVTMKHYAKGEKQRQDEKLKKVGNAFA